MAVCLLPTYPAEPERLRHTAPLSRAATRVELCPSVVCFPLLPAPHVICTAHTHTLCASHPTSTYPVQNNTTHCVVYNNYTLCHMYDIVYTLFYNSNFLPFFTMTYAIYEVCIHTCVHVIYVYKNSMYNILCSYKECPDVLHAQ